MSFYSSCLYLATFLLRESTQTHNDSIASRSATLCCRYVSIRLSVRPSVRHMPVIPKRLTIKDDIVPDALYHLCNKDVIVIQDDINYAVELVQEQSRLTTTMPMRPFR